MDMTKRPAKKPPKVAKTTAAPATPPAPARPRELVVTTFRVWSDQLDTLQRIALDRQAQRKLTTGQRGRIDHSEVVRELIDAAHPPEKAP